MTSLRTLSLALTFASVLPIHAQADGYPLVVDHNSDEDLVAAVFRSRKPVIKGKMVMWKPTAEDKVHFPAPADGFLYTTIDTVITLDDGLSSVITFSTRSMTSFNGQLTPCMDYGCDPVMGLLLVKPTSPTEKSIVAAQPWFTGLSQGGGLPAAKNVISAGKATVLVVERFIHQQGYSQSWLGWYDMSYGHELAEILSLTGSEWNDMTESGTSTNVSLLRGDGTYEPLLVSTTTTKEYGTSEVRVHTYQFDETQHRYVEKATSKPKHNAATYPTRKN